MGGTPCPHISAQSDGIYVDQAIWKFHLPLFRCIFETLGSLLEIDGSQMSNSGVPQHPRKMHAAPGWPSEGRTREEGTQVELGSPTPLAPTPGTGKTGQRESNNGE